MTANNLTIKAQELLQQAVNLAVAGGQQAVEPVHILSAMLREEDSIGVYLLNKIGVNMTALRTAVEGDLSRLPKVSGGEPLERQQQSAAKGHAGHLAVRG